MGVSWVAKHVLVWINGFFPGFLILCLVLLAPAYGSDARTALAASVPMWPLDHCA
jgi:hypothetical protein